MTQQDQMLSCFLNFGYEFCSCAYPSMWRSLRCLCFFVELLNVCVNSQLCTSVPVHQTLSLLLYALEQLLCDLTPLSTSTYQLHKQDPACRLVSSTQRNFFMSLPLDVTTKPSPVFQELDHNLGLIWSSKIRQTHKIQKQFSTQALLEFEFCF